MNRYEKNAFRILGLSVTASGREVIRREQEIVRYLEMGRAPSGRDDLPALTPSQRTVQEVRDAAQRLSDPPRRIREELFWFHLDDVVGEPARQAYIHLTMLVVYRVDSRHKYSLYRIKQRE